MFEESINQPFDVVPNKWGHVRATTSGNVATLTAVDQTVKAVRLQCRGNASAVVVNVNAAASADIGLVVPVASLTAAGGGDMFLTVSSLTCLQFYAAEDGDTCDVLYRG